MPARRATQQKASSSSSQSNNTKRKRKDDTSSDEESDHEVNLSQPIITNGAKKAKPNSICGYQLPKMRDGSIVRIKIHNFMTYDDCEFFPGPGLNLVLGPNGTGKSSIVGAICVGLAGHTKLLGRASKVSDMIKHGKKEAFVEIELKAKKNVVIKRSFQSRDGKESSDWRVNGTKKTAEEVRGIIEGFNIQLDNLTQFLPQEKVCEFAGLDSTQRLEQTQFAVLPPEVIQYQKDLIKKQEEFKNSSVQLDTLTKQLDVLKKKNATLEKEVEKYNQRKKYLEEAELCKIKKPVLQFKNIQEKGKQLKELEIKLAKEVATQQQVVGPLKDTMEELDKSIKKTEVDMRNDRSRINTNKEKIARVIDKFSVSNTNIEKYKAEVEKVKQNENVKKAKIQKLEQEIKVHEARLAKINVQEIKELIKEKNDQAREQDDEYRKITDKKYELNESFKAKKDEMEDCKRKIHKLDNVKEQRLKKMRENRLDYVVRVYEWYMQNRSQFLKPVFCIPLEVAPTKPLFGSFIEMHCPQYVFRSFVTQCPEDRDRLQKYATENNIRLSVILPDNLEYRPIRSCSAEQLKQYGFISYLDEQYSAPDAVKSCIKDLTQMDTVAVSENPNAKVSELLMKTPIQCAFIPNQQYLMKTSAYDKSKSTRVVDVNPARVFLPMDLSEKEGLETELKNLSTQKHKIESELNQLHEIEVEITKKVETIRAERRELEKRLKEHGSLSHGLNLYKTQKQDLEKSGVNLEQLERENFAKIKSERKKQINYHIELKDFMKETVSSMMKNDKLPLSLFAQRKELDETKIRYQESTRSLREAETRLETTKHELNRAKEELRQIKTTMNNALEDYSRRNDISIDELRDRLTSLPETEDELSEKMEFYYREAEKITANASVLDEYAKRLAEIEEKEKQIKELENASETMANIVEELKEKWLKPLKECIAKINDTFTEYCKHVGIAGEVTLVGDENNFKSFQIDIKVKFRDSEKLTSLSAHRQSGGERSVTTILYLLSLQQLNKSPFRVVDEINQGMDPQNERKIFYQMLDSSQGEDIPQSFLITPKLLPDLVPNNANNITVIFVFNGPANISQDEMATFFASFDRSMELKGELSKKV